VFEAKILFLAQTKKWQPKISIAIFNQLREYIANYFISNSPPNSTSKSPSIVVSYVASSVNFAPLMRTLPKIRRLGQNVKILSKFHVN